MSIRWPALLLALALSPPAARADDPRLAKRLPDSVSVQVEALLDSAAAQSLPREPLVQRALEGATKGADGARIVRAVRLLLSRLRGARDILGPQSSSEEIVAAATCLQAGADTTDIRLLREARPKESLVVPLTVLVDLVGRGAPVALASSTTLALVQARVEDDAILQMRKQIEREILAGAAPEVAVSQQTRILLPRGLPRMRERTPNPPSH
jgi:hypothetical protein